jgi:hypothetical protein
MENATAKESRGKNANYDDIRESGSERWRQGKKGISITHILMLKYALTLSLSRDGNARDKLEIKSLGENIWITQACELEGSKWNNPSPNVKLATLSFDMSSRVSIVEKIMSFQAMMMMVNVMC